MTEIAEKSRAITVLHVTGAIILSCVLVAVGAEAAKRFHLPFIHGWGLMHGAIFIVFPGLFLIVAFPS
jgi:hypothetical protein